MLYMLREISALIGNCTTSPFRPFPKDCYFKTTDSVPICFASVCPPNQCNQCFSHNGIRYEEDSRATSLKKFFKLHSCERLIFGLEQALSQRNAPVFGIVFEVERGTSYVTKIAFFQMLSILLQFVKKRTLLPSNEV